MQQKVTVTGQSKSEIPKFILDVESRGAVDPRFPLSQSEVVYLVHVIHKTELCQLTNLGQ